MSADLGVRYFARRDDVGGRGCALVVVLAAFLISVGCGGASTKTMIRSGQGPVAASVSGTIGVGTAPNSVVVDSTENKIYVADFGKPASGNFPCPATGSNVTVIDGASESTSTAGQGVLGNPLPVDANVLAVAMNSADHTVYEVFQVPGPNLNKTCFTPEDFLVAINGGPQPNAGLCVLCKFGGMAVNPVTGTVYLGNWYELLFGRAVKAYISVFVAGSNFSNFTAVSLTSAPIVLAVNPTTNKIYVGLASEIDVIDGTTNSLTKLADIGVAGPNALAVNPTTNTIYIASSGSNNITVIDGATGSVKTTIQGGTSPVALAVDEQTNFVYVANGGNAQAGDSGNITVINGATNATQTLTDSNAKNPVAVAVNSITNKIYVANSGSDNVTVMDGAHE